MQEALNIAAEQAPTLFVLVFLVVIFILSTRKTTKSFLEHLDNKDIRTEQMVDKMAETVERNTDKMNAAIEKNTDKINSALERNTEVLTHVKIVLDTKKQSGRNE